MNQKIAVPSIDSYRFIVLIWGTRPITDMEPFIY